MRTRALVRRLNILARTPCVDSRHSLSQLSPKLCHLAEECLAFDAYSSNFLVEASDIGTQLCDFLVTPFRSCSQAFEHLSSAFQHRVRNVLAVQYSGPLSRGRGGLVGPHAQYDTACVPETQELGPDADWNGTATACHASLCECLLCIALRSRSRGEAQGKHWLKNHTYVTSRRIIEGA
jgi:hypothetical protein